MKNKLFNLMAIFFVASLTFCFTACGGDDDEKDDNIGSGGASSEFADPDGTQVCIIIYYMDMYNEYESSGASSMGQYHIHLSGLQFDFSYGVDGAITSVGPVRGLADIKSIPANGYSQSAGFLPGMGYVAKMNDGVYIRMYALDYVKAGNGNIIGITFKYQYPFEP